MSSFDANFLGYDADTQAQREKGTDAYLSQEERDQVQRMLGFPEEFPRKLGAWMVDYMGTNGFFQQSQVQGLPLIQTQVNDALAQLDSSQIVASFNAVATQETTGSGSYVDLSTVGPQLTGLSDGTYLLLYGCQMDVTANIWGGAMSVAWTGQAATDGNGFYISMTTAEGAEVEAYALPGMRALLAVFSGGSTTVTCKYRFVGGTNPSYSNRWLVALRVSA